LTFGAWCDREYGFIYDEVRAHHGLAWYPVWEQNTIMWHRNSHYRKSNLIRKKPGNYKILGIQKNIPIYTQFEKNPDAVQFVSDPILKKDQWEQFIP
jgi:glucose-6-phosphate isomerase